jgi:hypothetical protein
MAPFSAAVTQYVHDNIIIQAFSYSCTHIMFTYIYMAHFPLLPLLSPSFPLVPLSTYLAPSSCDRNRPPPSQVACKLTLFAPPFTQLSHPFQLPRIPTAQRLTMTTLGLFRSCYAEQFHFQPKKSHGTVPLSERNLKGILYLQTFCLVLFLLQAFCPKAILCVRPFCGESCIFKKVWRR